MPAMRQLMAAGALPESDKRRSEPRNPSGVNAKGLIQREPQSCGEYPVGRRPGSQIQSLGLDGGQVRNCGGITKELFKFL